MNANDRKLEYWGRRKGCGRKVQHDTREDAERAKNKLCRKNNLDAEDMNVYLCIYCGSYHVGRNRKAWWE